VRQLKIDQRGTVGLVNVGESRADPIVDWRIGWEGGVGDVFPLAVRELLQEETRPQVREQVEKMLTLGKVKRVSQGPATA
jgi:NAD-dependent deacetylase sirtuin 4